LPHPFNRQVPAKFLAADQDRRRRIAERCPMTRRSTPATTAADLTVQARSILQSLMKRMAAGRSGMMRSGLMRRGHGALALRPAAGPVAGENMDARGAAARAVEVAHGARAMA
jgi:hypothetical protein